MILQIGLLSMKIQIPLILRLQTTGVLHMKTI